MGLSAPSPGAHTSLLVCRRILYRFLDLLTAQGRALQGFVQREFDDYLKCGRLECGFPRVGCEHCHTARLVENSSL